MGRDRRGDLSDADWERLRPFLPVSNGRCGRWRDHRQVIDGILHQVRTGVNGVICRSGSGHGRRSTSAIGSGQRTALGNVYPTGRPPACGKDREADGRPASTKTVQEAQHCRAGHQQAEELPRCRDPLRQARIRFPRHCHRGRPRHLAPYMISQPVRTLHRRPERPPARLASQTATRCFSLRLADALS